MEVRDQNELTSSGVKPALGDLPAKRPILLHPTTAGARIDKD